MLGDGSCLFHALGYYAKRTQKEVRKDLASLAAHWWNEQSGWGLDVEYWDFVRDTVTDGVCGDGEHLALASRFYSCRIRLPGSMPYTFGDTGDECMLRYDSRTEHYEVMDDRDRRKRNPPSTGREERDDEKNAWR